LSRERVCEEGQEAKQEDAFFHGASKVAISIVLLCRLTPAFYGGASDDAASVEWAIGGTRLI
jgi:hypothetical protein